MNGLVLTTTVHTQLAIKSMVEKLRQNERGASALEYVGMLLVGAMFVAGVVAAVNKDQVTKWVQGATKVIDGINP